MCCNRLKFHTTALKDYKVYGTHTNLISMKCLGLLMIYLISLSASLSELCGDKCRFIYLFIIPGSFFYLLAHLLIIKNFAAVKMVTVPIYKTKKEGQCYLPNRETLLRVEVKRPWHSLGKRVRQLGVSQACQQPVKIDAGPLPLTMV